MSALEGCIYAICASPRADMVPEELVRFCDAVYWKGLSGYDFSAYSLGLHSVAADSPGSDVLVINDSVLGPFNDIDAMLRSSRWRLTGFTASSAFENHVQSYAWFLRDVNPELVAGLSPVITRSFAYDHFQHVVNCQETQFARVASGLGTVGAFWFGSWELVGDPLLRCALPLLDSGFPFMKKSLLGGKLGHLYDQDSLRQRLLSLGHPLL